MKETEKAPLKRAHQAAGRISERTLTENANTAKKVPHLPEIYASDCDLTRNSLLPDGVRQRLSELQPDRFAAAEDTISTRIIVFKLYLPLKIRLAQYPDELIDMVDQMTDALHALRYDALVLHRDVSFTNIMWDPEHEGDGVHFVLTDFDLAVRLDSNGTAKGATAQHRAGTLPFMAVELLKDMAKNPRNPQIAHELRHDYESLFWVAAWSMMKTEDKIEDNLKREIKLTIAKWETGDYQHMADRKVELLLLGEGLDKLPFTPCFEHLLPLLQALSTLVFIAARYDLNKAMMMAEGSAQLNAAAIQDKWINCAKIKDALAQARVMMRRRSTKGVA
ncbi:hypothetical protein C2E23DRAFT_625538 [Lenzites betulinus]|nr:hypothetical protein C2E23DRAFT_625538 [Lenzites betulinus]